MLRKMSILGVLWGPLGAPFGRHFRVIFGTFWRPRLRRGSGGLLGGFWGRFWEDFGSILVGFWHYFGLIFSHVLHVFA